VHRLLVAGQQHHGHRFHLVCHHPYHHRPCVPCGQTCFCCSAANLHKHSSSNT
jgi:hypothetical protein